MGLFDRMLTDVMTAAQGLQGAVQKVLGPRVAIALQLEQRALPPGTALRGVVSLSGPPEAPRMIRLVRLHVRMVSTVLRPQAVPGGKWVSEWVQEPRELLEPLVLAQHLVLPPGQGWSAPFEVVVPQGLTPTMPNSVEYQVVAWAIVEGQTIDSVTTIPLVMLQPGAVNPAAASAQPFAVPVATPPAPSAVATPSAPASGGFREASPPPPQPAFVLAPGVDCMAPSPDGTSAPAMVVEHRGAVTLVQWKDGKAATWVRSEQLRPL